MPKKEELKALAAQYGLPSEAVDQLAQLMEAPQPPASAAALTAGTVILPRTPAQPDFEPTLDSLDDPQVPFGDNTLDSGHGVEVAAFEPTLDSLDSPAITPIPNPPTAALSQEEPSPATLTARLVFEARDVFGPQGRYEDLGLLGHGGMGEVRQVKDKRLGRTLAMKIMHGQMRRSKRALGRFLEEAQIGAQLQHPGTIPVHDMGKLPDGSLFFTMRQIHGKELRNMVYAVHQASNEGRWQAAPSGWTFQRLVNAFWRVCETMAYAHTRGIIHRDLKPANIMVGQNNEVLVVDWGLALAMDQSYEASEAHTINTLRTRGDIEQTSFGKISGTPAYMPPEQAHGHQDQIDERTDVYSLGAILYHIMTGQPPYTGAGPMVILSKLLKGPPPPPQEVTALPLPAELGEICMRALQHKQSARFANARELADAVSTWLEGVKKRQKANALVQSAALHQRLALAMQTQAQDEEHRGQTLLQALPAHSDAHQKADGWAHQDKARQLRQQAALEHIKAEQMLRGALIHAPNMPEAHTGLAEHYETIHRQSERDKDLASAQRTELLLREHVQALPDKHLARQRLERYLQGTGALTLVTEPAGVRVALHRMELRNRRLQPIFVRDLGQTPLLKLELEMGSYLLVLSKTGFEDVHYPINIGRMEHWDGVAPNHSQPTPIWMPPTGSLQPNERYVPAGWFTAGGDSKALGALTQRRLWCDGFIMEQDPVTNQRLLNFLNALVDEGRTEEALLYVPRERAASNQRGAELYGQGPDGHFVLQADADGDIWHPLYPAIMINHDIARAFARWQNQHTGQRWRLPMDLEWEKAARGVDGRSYPWGDWLDPSWCCMRHSHSGQPLPATVEQYPEDISPYGVRGMAGNVMDMCLNHPQEETPDNAAVTLTQDMLDPKRAGLFVCRGGAWLHPEHHCRSARRHANVHTGRQSILGFRLVRSVQTKPH